MSETIDIWLVEGPGELQLFRNKKAAHDCAEELGFDKAVAIEDGCYDDESGGWDGLNEVACRLVKVE